MLHTGYISLLYKSPAGHILIECKLVIIFLLTVVRISSHGFQQHYVNCLVICHVSPQLCQSTNQTTYFGCSFWMPYNWVYTNVLAMFFDNVSKVLRYIVWPVEFCARLTLEFILGIVFGWSLVSIWILFNIGFTGLLYLSAQAIISWGAVRLRLITIHWIRITELVKSLLVQNHVNGKTPGLFETIDEGEENIILRVFSYGVLLGAVIGILLMMILMNRTTV